jgi:putative ABC transport system permease protein
MLGGALGILIAKGGMSILLAAMPDGLPRASEIVLDRRALGFTWVLAMLTGVSFGLVPALQASRAALNETLKDGTRGTSGGGGRLLGALVVVEVAIALVLLAGGGLLIRSFLRLQEVEPGFQPRDAYIASLELPGDRYRSPTQQAAFAADATARLGAIPGVHSVGAANLLPYSGTDFNLIFSIVGRPPVPAGAIQSTLYYEVTPDYFKAMGVPLRRGRFFTSADDAAATRVAIINEMMARRFFPDEDPIGKRIKVTDAEAEIVGIVANVQQYDPTGDIRPQTYEPFAQVPFSIMSFVVRITPPRPGESGGAATATALAAAIRAAIHAIDKDQPVASVRPLADPVASSVARPRFAALIFAVFSGVALLLAAIGIYGVLAYTVNQRANEIGIRMALGAQRGDVLGLVLGQGGRLVAVGLVIGLAGALALTRFLSALLFGVTAHDPFTFAAIAALLATVATLACLIPARRATRIDPAVMLRSR